MSNYSHILSIKVLDDNSRTIDSDLTQTVKDQFLKEPCSHQGIPVVWRKIHTNQFFDVGDIVTLTPFGEDKYIKLVVRNTIHNIQNSMNIPGKTILFNIVKPLVTRHVILDSFGTIYPDGTIE